MKKILSAILLSLLLVSCSTDRLFIDAEQNESRPETPPQDEEVIYQTFLIGDAGAPSLETQEPTLKLLQSFLEQAEEESAVIFLGDNLYPRGLPDSTHPRRSYYEQRLTEQLDIVDNYPGRVLFIPGNHDWNDGEEVGLETLKRQERFVEAYLNRGNTFLPDSGFPGPVTFKLMDDNEHPQLREDIRLVVLDTQWWLHKHEKPYGDTGEYELFDAGDVLIELDDILKKQRNDHLMIAAHHPIITHDNHGGYQPPSVHLKPPIFGSFYALYRRAFGKAQDVNHHGYAKMAGELEDLFNRYELEDLIYASAHSHNLQYHRKEDSDGNLHYLISGSGSKQNYVAQGRGAAFSYAGRGFMSVKYYTDGSIWMEAWAPEGDGSTGKLIYRTQLKEPYEDAFEENQEIQEVPDIDYTDSTKVMAANADYSGKSRLFEWFVGAHNRDYWVIKNEFPVFDVTEKEGGLTPVRVGGKGQSTTLHLEREDGRDYVLRTLDKEAGRVWDEELRKTIALDVAQDQFSIINPYAAVIIPPLADAIGTFHTNPELYYVPHDPMLGAYTEDLSGEAALFEERPNGDMSDVESVGYSEEILSEVELLRELDNDIDHRVVQDDFARNRLLDMLLADWDRHGDQWRWASFEPEDEQGKLYRPIPRDRDLALMRMTGLLPNIAKVLGPFKQYQNFSESYGNLKGLNNNSLSITRRFTNQLTKEEWISIAEEIRDALTDEVIEKAVRNYPDPVFEEFGDQTTRLLKIRRDELPEIAERYYGLISEVVSIPGSNKREQFEVEILSEEEVRVQVFKLSGKGELRKQYFDRVFHTNETKEIRLFGMGDDDRFILKGDTDNDTEFKVVGGSGGDEYHDMTQKNGWAKQVAIHDTRQGNTIVTNDNAKVSLANIPENVRYDYKKDYRWNALLAGLYFEYNGNDGLFLGGGPEFIRHGFRKHPASRHFVRANYAPATGAANIRYDGKWYQAVGDWRVQVKGEFLFPKSYKNFFGLGNETTLEGRSLNYYRARLYQYEVEPKMVIQRNTLEFYGGTRIRATNVDRDPDNIVSDPGQGLPRGQFDELWFGGFLAGLTFKDLDDGQNPRTGYRWSTEAEHNIGMINTEEQYARIQSELELYVSPRLNPQITFANRTGGAHNFSEYPFYEANSLGGTTNLRGYNSRRFSGRGYLFNNTEVRLELFDFYRYLLGGKVGINGFFDTGRVWVEDESSSLWHTGYGGGIWFHAFDAFLLNANMGFSEEGHLLTIKAGFLF
ncbi:BamA/TamA family outer membrane protein [Gracilimonas mengyeensis]|uniref:Calcineurin-like phosphoesterase n=1 Tax=Gracilimonas mengyeensis TaxID=1302730 RepID=A0A521DEK1_9BACT|nr:BamA/TamA family outer membrane protein [Gracilimonas mengyeensis]SMO70012.1 Calcineurin-like phosphoesterase [Gracilimonas mengyeensis]